MPLRITSAPVSGVKKRKQPAHSKPRISPFAKHARRKATVSSASGGSKSEDRCDDDDQAPLPDLGLTQYIPETAPVDNVVSALQYIRDDMFEDLPERAGMNSTQIAHLLNFRRLLPPLASVAHVHTLLDAPTKVEREIMELTNAGRIRRLIVPGRGNDAAGLGDCLVLAEDWERLVRESSGLDRDLKEKFLTMLGHMGNTSTIPAGAFSPSEYMAIVRAGFAVSSSSLAKGSLSVPSLPDLPTISSAMPPASRAGPQSGDLEDTNRSQFHTATLFLSLPNTGPYLRLLGVSRAHLMSLLQKSKYGEAPLYLLRDRWDGAVESGKSFSVAKRARGEYSGLLPGKTKKWKELYGMSFRWIAEEAIGAGLIEIFDTGSVGPGVRCL